MREFSTQATQALVNGLKPNEAIKDTMYMEDLYNIVPYNLGPRPFESVLDVLDLKNRSDLYPFPQWFKFENESFIVTNYDLFKVNESYLPFDIVNTPISNWDTSLLKEPFRYVDYGDNWILTNRFGTIYKYNGEIATTKNIAASSIALHLNRTIIAGPQNGLWTSEWVNYLRSYITNSKAIVDEYTLPLSKNVVFWSSFDSLDFPFGLIIPRIVFNDVGLDSIFSQQINANEFGFIKLPFDGDILDMFPIGQELIVLQSNGMCILRQVTDTSGSGYVLTASRPVGGKSRFSIGGDENSVVFIDSRNNLWKYDRNQGLRNLDFSNYMSELNGDIYIHKDFEDNIFYIGDQNISFLLVEDKLTRIFQTVISHFNSNGFRSGTVFETGNKKARFTTMEIDAGIAALKTLTGFEIGLDNYVRGYAKAFSQVGNKKISGAEVPINFEGYAATRMFGKNHKVHANFDNYENLNIDFIELKWQIDDRRQSRGIYATQDASRTSQ